MAGPSQRRRAARQTSPAARPSVRSHAFWIAVFLLLTIANTESDVFLEIESQRHFALISGRWYATKSLEAGPWSYVASENLPASFRQIPADSKKAHVLASVSGSELATST